MKYMLLLSIAVFFLLNCEKKDEHAVSGQVVNAFTQQPVVNAMVQLLEDGAVTVTDAQGMFRFDDGDIAALSQSDMISLDGQSGVAISISRDTYRPIETNVVLRENVRIEMLPDSVPIYRYSKPVQLNDGIQTAALDEAGFDVQIAHDLMNKLYGGDYREIHSLLVYHNDKLVLEEYFSGNNDTIQFENNIAVDRTPADIQWTRNAKHYVASVNKALTATVVGIAMDAFDVPVDAKISGYLPEYTSYFTNPGKAPIDFSDCLTMTAGLQWDEWGSNDLALLWKSDDFADFVLSRNSLGVGAEWRYNSALPNLELKAMETIVGEPIRDWAMENFYHKLGITNLNWQSQPDGYPEGSARMFIRPRDMLKIGITYLNHGVWNNEQVIPAGWVDACFETKEQTTSGNYSYHFWLRTLDGVNYLSADGDGGNYINIIPELDMVIVVTQGNYGLWPFYVNQVNDMMENFIFPAVR